jgi:hypothetical protein
MQGPVDSWSETNFEKMLRGLSAGSFGLTFVEASCGWHGIGLGQLSTKSNISYKTT